MPASPDSTHARNARNETENVHTGHATVVYTVFESVIPPTQSHFDYDALITAKVDKELQVQDILYSLQTKPYWYS